MVRFSGLFGRRRREHELAEELESHVQLHIDDNIRAGMSPREARRQALLKLGGMEQTKELYRDRRGLPWLETLLQDLRFAVRTLRKAPGFTAVAVITLALGIGANTAIFSAVNAALLRPLPYRDPRRLVWVTEIWHKEHDNESVPSPDYINWSGQAYRFAALAAYDGGGEFNLTEPGRPERIEGVGVTANFFQMLGVQPVRGRVFRPQEMLPNGPAVAILSNELWQTRFARDPNVLGKTVTLDNQRYVVVGVMAPGFRFPDQDLKPEVFIPFQLPPRVDWYAKTLADTFVIGRLKPDASPEQARAELGAINQRDFAQVSPPFVRMGRRNVQVQVLGLQSKLAGDFRPALLVLLGAVGFVLLIACTNIANLQLARTAGRQQELAVRAAIGAGRGRLIWQLLTESAMLAGAGGMAGLGVGLAGVHILRRLAPQNMARIGAITVDESVLAFTLVVTCVVTVLFGLLPAVGASRPNVNEGLKSNGSRMAGARGGRKLRRLLASGELALALVLLVGSGLLLRSFIALSNVDPGFDPHGVLTARLNLPPAKYSTPALEWEFLQKLMERLRVLPGVESVGVTNVLLLTGYAGSTAVRFEGQPSLPPGAAPSVPIAAVSPDYFRTVRVPLIAGRFFNIHDGTHNDYPLIVNRAFARRFFFRQEAIGKRVRVGAPDWPWRTIKGVVGDVRQVGISQPPEAEIYRPYASPTADPVAANEIWVPATITIRSKSNLLALTAGLRQQLAGLDPELPISDIATMDQRLARELAPPRFNTMLLGVFAGFALLLAVVGIYGVVAYFASQRTHEIGIRMALGAVPEGIVQLLMREAVVITLLGLTLGLGGALAVTRFMASLLFEIRPTDPVTFAVVLLVMTGVALIASYFPARRATKVDPMEALRYE